MTKAANHNVYFVPGLHRGLRVLEILGAAETPMSLSEIARAMELSRSSAYRLVYTLRHMEFIQEAEQANTFTLGARVLNGVYNFSDARELLVYDAGPSSDDAGELVRNLLAAGYPREMIRYYRGGMQVWSVLGFSIDTAAS